MKLHDYQNSIVNFAVEKKKCALFLDMGLGKTIIALTALTRAMEGEGRVKALIIAPLHVAKHVWKQEIEKWTHTKHLKVSLCLGNENDRKKAFMKNADVYITNRESVVWMCENVRWMWKFLIVDESSSFKSYKASRTSALIDKVYNCTNIILLSGTPSPNDISGLWSQMYLIDHGKRLGNTFYQYRKEYFMKVHCNTFSKFVENTDAKEIVYKKIKDVCRSLTSDSVKEVNVQKIYITINIDMGSKAKKQYAIFEKEFIATFDNVDIVAGSAAVAINKLRQICNGFLYDENRVAHWLHKEKVRGIRDIVEDNPNENILVAYEYKADLEVLLEAFPLAVHINEENAIERWNNKEIQILLAHPKSAGYGLNLQNGGSMIVWYSMTWSMEEYAQFNARVARQGQKSMVRIIHIINKGLADDVVMHVVRKKTMNNNALMKYFIHQ